MEPRTCRCGHNKDHYMVSPQRKYSGGGWLMLILLCGGATPNRIVYKCVTCDETVWETTDPDICRAQRG